MTKIVIPEDLTIMHSEAKRLREERDTALEDLEDYKRQVLKLEDELAEQDEEIAKIREVNAEQASQIAYWRDRAHHAEDQLRRAQQDRLRRG